MSEFETLDVAKQRAKQKAERNAQEQAGVFVASYTKVKNFQVQEDEIIAITSGILKILDVQEKLTPLDDGKSILIKVTIKASIDSDDVNKWLEKGIEQRFELSRENEFLRKENAEQAKKLSELQEQAKHVKTQQEREKIAREFAEEDRIFLSNQILKQIGEFDTFVFPDKVIDLCNRALALNRHNEKAYYMRGEAYYHLENYNFAISDLNESIMINSDNLKAYLLRGDVNGKIQNYRNALSDYDKALQCFYDIYVKNPKIYIIFAMIHSRKGIVYYNLGDYYSAIDEFTIALNTDPDHVVSYGWRSKCYKKIGEYSKAQEDDKKAYQIFRKNPVKFDK